jgi:hypothetical protein
MCVYPLAPRSMEITSGTAEVSALAAGRLGAYV